MENLLPLGGTVTNREMCTFLKYARDHTWKRFSKDLQSYCPLELTAVPLGSLPHSRDLGTSPSWAAAQPTHLCISPFDWYSLSTSLEQTELWELLHCNKSHYVIRGWTLRLVANTRLLCILSQLHYHRYIHSSAHTGEKTGGCRSPH